MTTRNARNVELALCNDSDCSERTSSDRTFIDDMAIVNRLQYLTQRVEDLERKLEKRMPMQSDNLSFALSVDHNNSVPNVDIKVLSGPREPYSHSTGDERDLMCGWEDGIVERNTSFLIIPIEDDKDLQLNEPHRLKRTLDGTLEPTASLPALCCANAHSEMMDSADDHELALHATPFSTHRAISVSVIPMAGNFTNQCHAFESEHTELTSDSSFVNSNECFNDVRSKLSGSDEQKERVEEKEQSEHHQDRDRVITSISHGKTPQLDGTLRYGYTISVAGVSPHKTKPLPIQPRVFHVENNNEKDIQLERRDSDNTVINQDFASDEENKSTVPRYVVRSSVLATSENVCYTDAQRNDNDCDRLNGHGEMYDDDDDDTAKHHHGLHQHFVKSHTWKTHSIEKQFKNAESRINGPKGREIEHGLTSGKMSLFDDVSVEKEVEEITSRLDRVTGTGSDKDEQIQMQIEAKDRLWRCKELYCPGNGSDDLCVLSGLANYNTWYNTSSLKETNDLENNTLHKNNRPHCASNKTAARKVRVRSLELPLTSSEEDLTLFGDPGLATNPKTTRPQRKKQRNRTAKSSFAARNNMTCHEPTRNLEQQLKELIDPGEIGDLQDEIAAVNRPLLLAIMSPTDSGYIGSNTDSPRNVWKDHYYETPNIHEPSTPVVQTPFDPSNLYSSSPKGNQDPVSNENVYLYHSVGSHSSRSSTVSYVGGSDYSELSYGEDLKVPSLRLQEYFPGPSRIPFDNHTSTVRLNEYLLNRHPIASPTSSVGTSDLSDSFFGSESDYCECQTGIATEHDFREELKSISRYVLEAGEKTEVLKKASKPLQKYHLDEEQGEMDIFGARLQKGEHKAVPILVKVILRLRKHFFGGIEGPNSLKSLSPRKEQGSFVPGSRARKISFSPSAMLLSAVGERSAAEIRDVIEKDRVDVNQFSPSGKSLLHKAAVSGDLESIHTLIQYGAKVNLTDQDGFAPVHSALRRCHYKCAIFLVECGTDMAAYTRARIQELTMIKNMSSEYRSSVLNTPL